MAEFDILIKKTINVPDSITVFNIYCEIKEYAGEVYWECEKKSFTDNETHTIEICLNEDGLITGSIDDETWYERDLSTYKESQTNCEYAIEDAIDWIEEHFERCVKDMMG